MAHNDDLVSLRRDLAITALELQNARESAQHWKMRAYAVAFGWEPNEKVLHEKREALLLRKLRVANLRTFFTLIILASAVLLWL